MRRPHQRATGVAAVAIALGLTTASAALAAGPRAPFAPATSTQTAGTSCLVGSHAVSDGFLGMSGEGLRSPLVSAAWNDPAFVGVVAQLHPQVVRVFGGETADFWDWRTGTFTMDGPPGSFIVKGGPTNPVSLARFASVVTGSGARPLFDLNVVTDPADPGLSLDSQIAMLAEAQTADGLPVTRVELGNELYFSLSDPLGVFGTASVAGAAYGSAAASWITELQQRFPGVQVAVVGYPTSAGSQLPRARAWNSGLLPALAGSSGYAVTYHSYWPSGLTAPNLPTSGAQADLVWRAEQAEFAAVQGQELAQLPTGVPAWITEFNTAAESNPTFPTWTGVAGTWAQGLANVSYALNLYSDPRVGMAVHDSLVNNNSFGALSATPPYAPTADGVALAQLTQAATGRSQVQPLVLPGTQQTLGEVFSSATSSAAVLVNFSNAPETVTLPAPFDHGTVTQTAPTGSDPATHVTGFPGTAGAVGVGVTNPVDVLGQVTLAPYSLTTVSATSPAQTVVVHAVRGDGSAAVSWSPPASECPATSYTATASPGGASCTTATFGCTLTGLANGTTYRVSVVEQTSAGAVTAGTTSVTLDIPPTIVSGPAVTMVTPAGLTNSTSTHTLKVAVSWAASPGTTALCSYSLARSTDGGPYARLTQVAATTTSYKDSLTLGTRYAYRLTAVGCDGLAAVATGDSFVPGVLEESAPSWAYSNAPAWLPAACASCSGGDERTSATAGASATLTVTGSSQVGLVFTAGPGDGSASIWVDGLLVTTLNTHASNAQFRRILYRVVWATPGSHTVAIVNKGSAGHAQIELDAAVDLTSP